MSAVQHPNSRANLIYYKPGQSGNPGGRTAGAHTPADYLRFLQGEDFTTKKLRAILNGADEPAGKRMAARMMLSGVTGEDSQPHRQVEARRVFESINDRLEGTPVQSVRTIDMSSPDAGQVLSEIRANLVGADRMRFEELAAPGGLTLEPVAPSIMVADLGVESERVMMPLPAEPSASELAAHHERVRLARIKSRVATMAKRAAAIRAAVHGPPAVSSSKYEGASASKV